MSNENDVDKKLNVSTTFMHVNIRKPLPFRWWMNNEYLFLHNDVHLMYYNN